MLIAFKQIEVDDVKEWALNYYIVRLIFLLYSLVKYSYYYFIEKNIYLAVSATLRYERIITVCGNDKVSNFVKSLNERILNSASSGNEHFLKSFLETSEAHKYRQEFFTYGDEHAVRLKYPKINDYKFRQGDLLVLKPYISAEEKGVLFVQYNDSFKKLAALFDLNVLSNRYRFVLEPSWWGYRDSIFFLYLGLKTDVIIEAQHEDDYGYINHLGSNIHALRLGAGDWVDPDIFKPDESLDKIYDLVMVANWLKLKRHRILFEAVGKIKNKIGKIALIGYARGGRTIDDIKEEARQYGVLDKLAIFENISPEEVNNIIQKSRVGVMLTKKEGANKGIYECLFCNIPVILTARNIGVNRSLINNHTGYVVTDAELSDKIIYMLENLHNFSPRNWAYENTGYMNSYYLLNNKLKSLAEQNGEKWTSDIYCKKNATNAMYVYESDRLKANLEFDRLIQFLCK